MNKLLSEILRGNWMLSADAADKAMEIAYQILSGKSFEEKKKDFNLQLFDVNQAAIVLSNNSDVPTDLNSLPANTTAVVPINGVLTKYDNCGDYGTQSLASMIIQLADNPNVSAIVLHIDSPGGTADGSYDLAESIRYASSKKAVVTYADGLMASAAFRAGMNADTIIAKPGTIIGSIGTMFSIRINRDAKFEDVSVYADSSPEKNLPFEELVKNGNATLIKETLLNPMNEIFLNEVRQARPNIPETALKGATYIGKEAKKMGMYDKEGNLNTALQEAQKLAKQRQKTNLNNNNKMSFKTRFPGIAAFLGMTDEKAENKDTLTPDEIQSLEGLAGENARLATELATAKQSITEKETQITSLTTDRDEWKTKAETYGKQPGVMGVKTVEETAQTVKHDFSHVKEPAIKAMLEKQWNGKVEEKTN